MKTAKKTMAVNMVVEIAHRTDHQDLMASISGLLEESKVKIKAGSKKPAEIKCLGEDISQEDVLEAVDRCLGASHGIRIAWIQNYGL